MIKKQENFSCRSLQKFFVVCLLLASFPSLKDTLDYLTRVSFQGQPKALVVMAPVCSCFRDLHQVSGETRVLSFSALWCSPPHFLVAQCSPVSSCRHLLSLDYFSTQRSCSTSYFLYQWVILCLRMCVVCLYLSSYACLCVFCVCDVWGRREHRNSMCFLITVEGYP